ncbi:MAG: hypothetical protein AB1440_26485 [Pseudomonadota bacterium]
MAERDVREGEERIARQMALIDKLAHRGHSLMIYNAVVFLHDLQAVQRVHAAHLERLRNSG